jgi:hypothetical protein
LAFARVRGIRSRVDRLNDQRRFLSVPRRDGRRQSQRVSSFAYSSRAQGCILVTIIKEEK